MMMASKEPGNSDRVDGLQCVRIQPFGIQKLMAVFNARTVEINSDYVVAPAKQWNRDEIACTAAEVENPVRTRKAVAEPVQTLQVTEDVLRIRLVVICHSRVVHSLSETSLLSVEGRRLARTEQDSV